MPVVTRFYKEVYWATADYQAGGMLLQDDHRIGESLLTWTITLSAQCAGPCLCVYAGSQTLTLVCWFLGEGGGGGGGGGGRGGKRGGGDFRQSIVALEKHQQWRDLM